MTRMSARDVVVQAAAKSMCRRTSVDGYGMCSDERMYLLKRMIEKLEKSRKKTLCTHNEARDVERVDELLTLEQRLLADDACPWRLTKRRRGHKAGAGPQRCHKIDRRIVGGVY